MTIDEILGRIDWPHTVEAKSATAALVDHQALNGPIRLILFVNSEGNEGRVTWEGEGPDFLGMAIAQAVANGAVEADVRDLAV